MAIPTDKANEPSGATRVQRTIASSWMRGVAEQLRTHGLNVPALFAEAGLDIRVLERADGRLPVEQIDRLWMLAAKRSGQTFIALSRATVDNPTSFDMLAYAMMSCQNLAEAVVRLVQYCAVVSDAVALRVVDTGEGCRIEVTPMEPPIPGRSSRLDYTLVTFLAFCRWVTSRHIVPLGVELSYPAPTDLMQHQKAFACTPRFNAPLHALLLHKSDLQLPLPTANAVLSRLHDRAVQEHVKSLQSTGIAARMAAVLVRRIGSGQVMRRDIASDLCMSDRTLQRRLIEAGTSFQKELDALRRQLSETYLSDPALPLANIAQLLGFAEESTFYRACQRWFERSPKQARDDALGKLRAAQ
jgi:AraC-like DNA-binding protein